MVRKSFEETFDAVIADRFLETEMNDTDLRRARDGLVT